MADRIRFLRDIFLFSDLSAWDLRRISENAVMETHPRGHVVITEGQRGDAFYIILSGRCRTFTRIKTGRERTFAHLRRGDSFGEIALLTGEDYWSSVEVTNDAVLLKIQKTEFDRLLQKNPRLAIKFGEKIGRQLQSIRRTQKQAKWSRLIAAYSPALTDVRRVFSASLAASCAQETREPVCLIELMQSGTGMRTIGEMAEMMSHSIRPDTFRELFVEHPAGHFILTVRIDDDVLGERIFADLLDHIIRTFHYSIIDLPLAVGRTAGRVISQCDRMYLLSEADADSMHTTSGLVENFKREFLLKTEEVKIILCNLGHDERRTLSAYEKRLGLPVECAFDRLPEDIRRHSHDGMPYVLTQPHTPLSRSVRHIARELSNRLVGLALGAGAARGIAHIGVLRVLERENILIDTLAGSSIGAFIGSIWATGKNSREIEEIANKNRGLRALAANLFDPNFLSSIRKGGFLKGEKATAYLHRIIGDATFTDTLLPLTIVATNLNNYREEIFQDGRLFDAVRASIAIPGIFEPVRIDGKLLVDGGILNPLPISPLTRAGVSKIIAVNPLPGPDDFPPGGKFAPRTAGLDGLSWPERTFKRFARSFTGNIFDIIMSSSQMMEYVLAEGAGEEADIMLHPVLRDAVWYEFNEPAKYIARGIEEAERALPEIRRLMESTDG